MSPFARHVVFVFDDLPDWQALAAAAPEGAQVVVLDGGKDGLAQMAGYLQGRSGIDAIHVLSHGSAGRVQLGSTSLGVDEAQARAHLLSQIGGSLSADGDILLYGCDVASGDTGQQFIEQLAALTGADVAASVDATGSALQGGDWQLEAHAGTVESAHALAAQDALQDYAHLLAVTYSTAANPLSAIPRQAQSTIVGDFDGDGDVDVLTYNASFNALWLHRNDGTGVFTAVASTDASSPFRNIALTDHFYNSETTYIADFDGDGDMDIWDYAGDDHDLNATPSVNGPAIYLRNDGGTYVRLSGNANPLKDVASFQDFAIHGDFDGDGDRDVLAYKEGGLSLGYYQNNGAGTFTEVAYASSPFKNVAVSDQFWSASNTHVADFDGDGDLDVWDATGDSGHGGTPVYLQNNGGLYVRLTGAANPLSAVALTNKLAYAIHGDFDTDGDVDVLAFKSDGTTPEFLRNDGSGHFDTVTLAASPFAGITKPYWNLAATYVADFDNDGDVDIWDYKGDTAGIYTQQLGAPPKLSASTPVDNASGVHPGAPLALQFNEVIASAGTGSIRIYRSSDNALVQTIAANSASVTGMGTNTLTITPATPLADLTSYYVLIDKQALRDGDGMVFAGISDKTKLNFTTGTSNTVPTATNLTQTVPYTEDPGASVPLADIVITDPDGSDTLTATLTLSNPTAGALTVGTFGASTSTYTAGTGVWTVSGTLANVNAALAAVAFTPVANWDQDVTISTRIRDAANTGPANGTITLDVTPVNDTPTDIGLSAAVATHSGGTNATVGTLSSTDVDTGQTHTYTLVSGSGDTANALFNINGSTLRANDAAAMAPGQYSVRIQTNDGNSGVFAKVFTITVQDNLLPTVTSITRVGSASTNATSVQYTVTFSEAVTGVDTTDFTLNKTGTATGTVGGIAGSGTTYTVTVGGVSGTGDLRLDLKNTGTGIADTASNAIATGYTTGQTYTLDTDAPPAPAINGLAPGSDTGSLNTDRITSDDTPTISGTAEAGSTITLYDSDGTTQRGSATATGGTWTITSTVLSEGPHNLTVKATDAAGNTGLASSILAVTIDTSAPAAPPAPALDPASDSGALSTDGITADTTPTITGTAEAGSTVTLYDSDGTTALGNTVATGGTWSITPGTPLTGAHTFTVKATDVAGNTSLASAGLAVTIDTTVAAPSAPDLDAASDSGTSSTDNITRIATPTFTGTAEAGSTVTLYDTDGTTVLGSTVATGGNWSITTTSALPEGPHTVTAKAVDLAGNTSVASSGLAITIDTVAPAGSSPPNLDAASDTGASSTDNITAVTTPTFSGTSGLNANVTLYDTDGTTELGTTTADGAGNWSITSIALAAGAHTLTTKASDVAGNFSTASLTATLTIDPAAPAFASATVNGNTLVLTYTDAGTLDAVNAPAPGAFAVLVGATPNVVTAAVVNAASRTVTLTLTSAVNNGDVVTVAYNDPSGGNDANAIQDVAGNDAASLAATAVTNNTAAPDAPPVPPGTTVDGVPVVTESGPGGSTIVTIPVVVPTRPDAPGTPSPLADIPLVTAQDGHPIVQVSVPTGVGLQAEGLKGTTTGSAALAELGMRIERIAGTNPELTNAGQVFYATLSPTEPLSVQILKPTIGTSYDPAQPLVITGSDAAGDGKQAIILDARSLPSGTVIQVDNIDFIAVVGNVRLIGGAGQNVASGDGGNQWIVLGPDDDIIHGGAGNDTVGSLGGDDQLYGDAGDDTVFGGAGNDLLSGGTGSDRLNGGTGFDVAMQEGARSDYTVTLDGAGIKLTHTASGVSDWLVDVEQVRFATGPSLTVAHSAAEEAAAFLFQKWLGRDLNQGEGAIIQTLTGKTAQEVATLFAQLFPEQSAGKTPAQLLEGMAAAGAIRVDAVREVTVTGDAGNNTISPMLGLARFVDGGAGIDTMVIPATLAQTSVQATANGATLQRMTDGAMLDVTRVERITFSDTRLALDLNGHAGEAARLLGALAGPASLTNKGVVGEVIRLLDAGATSQTIAGVGLQLLGADTPAQVAQTLWTNVTGRAGTAPELKILTDVMASGVSAADLVVMAAHLDLTATRIDLVGLAAKGLEFA